MYNKKMKQIGFYGGGILVIGGLLVVGIGALGLIPAAIGTAVGAGLGGFGAAVGYSLYDLGSKGQQMSEIERACVDGRTMRGRILQRATDEGDLQAQQDLHAAEQQAISQNREFLPQIARRYKVAHRIGNILGGAVTVGGALTSIIGEGASLSPVKVGGYFTTAVGVGISFATHRYTARQFTRVRSEVEHDIGTLTTIEQGLEVRVAAQAAVQQVAMIPAVMPGQSASLSRTSINNIESSSWNFSDSNSNQAIAIFGRSRSVTPQRLRRNNSTPQTAPLLATAQQAVVPEAIVAPTVTPPPAATPERLSYRFNSQRLPANSGTESDALWSSDDVSKHSDRSPSGSPLNRVGYNASGVTPRSHIRSSTAFTFDSDRPDSKSQNTSSWSSPSKP